MDRTKRPTPILCARFGSRVLGVDRLAVELEQIHITPT